MLSEADFARIAGDLVVASDDVVASVVAAARDRIAALAQDESGRALLEASVAENIVAAVDFAQGRVRVEDLEAPAAALSYARTLAQRDVPLSALVRAYRVGHARVLDHAFEQIDAVPLEHQAAFVMALVRRSQDFIDRVLEQVGRAYEVERERWVASRSGVRQQWVNDLLAGTTVDVAEASATLGYPVDGRHVCVRLWPATPMTGGETATAVGEVRQHLASRLRARESLLVPTDERQVRLWLATSGPRDVTPPAECRLNAAISSPGTGLTGFRRTAEEADLVQAVVAARPGAPRWVQYDAVAPIALLARDPTPLRELVASTLGELAARTERAEMLRETLRAFLAHHRSYATTGGVLNLHRNSVQYRVQQALALLPRRPEDDLHLRVALDAAHWLGETVLGRRSVQQLMDDRA